MKALMILTLLALAGCQTAQPRATATVGITPDGVRIYPQLGISTGNIGLVISP